MAWRFTAHLPHLFHIGAQHRGLPVRGVHAGFSWLSGVVWLQLFLSEQLHLWTSRRSVVLNFFGNPSLSPKLSGCCCRRVVLTATTGAINLYLLLWILTMLLILFFFSWCFCCCCCYCSASSSSSSIWNKISSTTVNNVVKIPFLCCLLLQHMCILYPAIPWRKCCYSAFPLRFYDVYRRVLLCDNDVHRCVWLCVHNVNRCFLPVCP